MIEGLDIMVFMGVAVAMVELAIDMAIANGSF